MEKALSDRGERVRAPKEGLDLQHPPPPAAPSEQESLWDQGGNARCFFLLKLLATCRLLHSHPNSRRCSAAQTKHQSRPRAAVSPRSLPWQQSPPSTNASPSAGHRRSTQERRNIPYLPVNKHIAGCRPPSVAAAHRATPVLQPTGITPSPASPVPSQTSAPAALQAGTCFSPCSI